MFDTHVKKESKVVAVTQVVEKTITPDKVTEMYDKVRAQAEKDVISSLRVESNTLNGVVIQIADEYSTATSRLHTRFVLNKKEYTDVKVLDKREPLTAGEMYEKLADHYHEMVSRIVFRDGAEKLSVAFSDR
jgi:hypothetical protein